MKTYLNGHLMEAQHRQAWSSDSDCILKPIRVYADPQRVGAYLALCEVLDATGSPHSSNERAQVKIYL